MGLEGNLRRFFSDPTCFSGHLHYNALWLCKGSGYDDKVQQLQNLSSFGLANKEELERIGFDMTLLDTAAEMSARVGTLLGHRQAHQAVISEARINHDKAYTCLKRLVAEVRKYGKFVFYKDAEKRRAYTSAYTRKRNTQRSADAVPVVPVALAEAA